MRADEKKYTEREMVLAQRAAFDRGAACAIHKCMSDHEAEIHYPLPKVTRPRVVKDADGDSWRWVAEFDGTCHRLEIRAAGRTEWKVAEGWQIQTREIASVVADLLANPTEEVDADA